jgi:F-type H+-transporting ATPase subunit b
VSFDAWTFAFEAVNFLVLVWLLKRLLYKPVLAMIEARRKETADTLARAEARRSEAEQLRARYEARLAEWETERVRLRQTLEQEIAAARRTAMAELAKALDEERARAAVLDARRREEEAQKTADTALELAARFLSRLVERLAGPELEARLAAAFLDDLASLPSARREALARALHEDGPVRVASAYALQEPQRQAIQRALTAIGEREVPCIFEQDSALRAGLRVSAGALVLRANLADELGYFAGNVHGST